MVFFEFHLDELIDKYITYCIQLILRHVNIRSDYIIYLLFFIIHQFLFPFQRNLNLHIFTGILNDIKSQGQTPPPSPSFLDPTHRHIIVPDFVYKIVIDPTSNQGIAFIADNNPLNTAGQMCKTDICSDNQWPSYKQKYSGIIYCCTVSEMLALLQGVPEVPHVQGVLKGSKTLFTEPNDLLEKIEEVLA